MKKINFTLAGKKVVEKWKIWISISLSIVVIALIAFSIFAGVNKDAGRGPARIRGKCGSGRYAFGYRGNTGIYL